MIISNSGHIDLNFLRIFCIIFITFAGIVQSNSTVPGGYCGSDRDCLTEKYNSLSSKKNLLAANSPALMNVTVQVFPDNADPGSSPTSTQSAIFFPHVDVFTGLKVGSVSSFKSPNNRIEVSIVAMDRQLRRTEYKTGSPKLWFNSNGDLVSFRSVIVRLDMGVVQSIKWEPTSCGIGCACIENMCAECVDYNDQCNSVRIFVMWEGTDKDGRLLSSWSRSIYDLQSLP